MPSNLKDKLHQAMSTDENSKPFDSQNSMESGLQHDATNNMESADSNKPFEEDKFNSDHNTIKSTGKSKKKQSIASRKLAIIGAVLLIGSFTMMATVGGHNHTVTKGVDATEILSTGTSTSFAPDTILDADSVYQNSTDYQVKVDDGIGELTMSIWDYSKEDGDYVTVLVNKEPVTESFLLRNKSIDIKIPKDANIQVVGVKDGDKKGIHYAVYFAQNRQTYLNVVTVGASNTYQVIGE
jgi:hypothetical protein